MTGPGVHIRPARADELAACSGLLVDAARWIAAARPPVMWAEETLQLDRLLESYAPGEFRVGFVGDDPRPALTFVLQHEDLLFWPDVPTGEAWYLHKVAVARPHAGRGLLRTIVAGASAEAHGAGRRLLRLDVLAARSSLRRCYQDEGFVLHDQRTIAGHHVARYERATGS